VPRKYSEAKSVKEPREEKKNFIFSKHCGLHKQVLALKAKPKRTKRKRRKKKLTERNISRHKIEPRRHEKEN
jgi:hypothetical protein